MSLNEGVLSETNRNYFTKKLKVRNAAALHYLFARVFKLRSMSKETQNYVERFFTNVVESEGFLELDFTLVSKLFSSSELFITSEREVLDGAFKWLSRNFKKRSKFGVRLLRKVRLRLLFGKKPKPVESGFLSAVENKKCFEMMEKAYKSTTLDLSKSRCCNQNSFGVLACGDRFWSRQNVKQFSVPALKCVKVFPSMNENRINHFAVYLKGDIYVLAQPTNNHTYDYRTMLIEKYSLATNSWVDVAAMSDYIHYCACAFSGKIYITGRRFEEKDAENEDDMEIFDDYVSICYEFDTKTHQFKQVASMVYPREQAACAIFQERIVVSGGFYHGGTFRSAYCYNTLDDAWKPMQKMLHPRRGHKLVAVESKLFAIGGNPLNPCEVYDKLSNYFVQIDCPFTIKECQALSVGSKIFVFGTLGWLHAASYDVIEDKWSKESCEELTGKEGQYCCVKLPF